MRDWCNRRSAWVLNHLLANDAYYVAKCLQSLKQRKFSLFPADPKNLKRIGWIIAEFANGDSNRMVIDTNSGKFSFIFKIFDSAIIIFTEELIRKTNQAKKKIDLKICIVNKMSVSKFQNLYLYL